jgi:hypothetical protein
MTKSRPNIRTYIWTVSILTLCGLIIYFDSSLNTCYGLVHGFGDLFLLLILFVLLTAFLGRQVFKIVKKAENSKIRIWTSLIVIIASVTAFQGKSTWKNLRLGNSILSASIYPDQLDMGRLELIDEERYYALYGHIDWSCAFTDSYERNGDTLILAGQPFEKTDGILTDKYLITDSTLIPIKLTDRDMERTEIMKIEIKN